MLMSMDATVDIHVEPRATYTNSVSFFIPYILWALLIIFSPKLDWHWDEMTSLSMMHFV